MKPSAKSFQFKLAAGNGKQYDVAISANQIFPSEVGLRVLYREVGDTGDWGHVVEPSLYEEDNQTEDKFRENMKNAVAKINARIKEFFLLDDSEPEIKNLFDRVEHALVKNFSESNDEVIYNG